MHRNRIKKLIAHLKDNVKDEAFDMLTWQNDCGTVACAMGHATTIPEFALLGLTVEKRKDFFGKQIVYNNNVGFMAVALFFGIHVLEAEGLFSNVNYHYNGKEVSRQDVIDRLTNFLKKRMIR